MTSYSAVIPIVSFGLFFFVLCKENLDRRTGAVRFDIQRHLVNLIVNLAICLSFVILAVWFDNGSLLTSLTCSSSCIMLYVGYMVACENKMAAALLKKRNEFLAKAREDLKKKQNRR